MLVIFINETIYLSSEKSRQEDALSGEPLTETRSIVGCENPHNRSKFVRSALLPATANDFSATVWEEYER